MAALQSLIRHGYFAGDDTPFAGVRALPAHSTLLADTTGLRIVNRELPAAREDGSTKRARRALLDDLVDSVKAAAAPAAAFSGRLSLSLTGGRDSRLIAAALHSAGIRFRTTTSGFADHPDVVLAARVADLLGVEHRVSSPARDEAGEALVVLHPLRRAWDVIRSTEGMISAHNNVAKPRHFLTSPALAGSGGEQLRGGFLSNQDVPEEDALRARLRRWFLVSDHLFTDAANQRAQAALEPWAAQDPMTALDRIYLYYRSGRWSAAARAATYLLHPTFDLLFDNRLNRRALKLSPRLRWSEYPVHQVICRLAPALSNVPLAGKRWRYDIPEPRWPFRGSWQSRAPLPVDRAGAGFDWRNEPTPDLFQIFREQILGGPGVLFDVVRRPRMEALLAQERLKRSEAILIWNAYTASVILSGLWLERAPAAPSLTVPLPPRVRKPAAGGAA